MSRKPFAIIGNQAFSLLNFRSPLIRDIISRGYDVYALAPDFDVATEEQVRQLGAVPVSISLSRTGLNPLRDLLDVVKLARVLARLRPETVLSFSIKPVIYGTLAARFAGVPHRYALIAGLGYAFGDSARATFKAKLLHYLARGLYKLSLSQAELVFMQNPDDAADFVRMGIVDGGKIQEVNGTGVDLSTWPVLPPVDQPMTFLLAARLLAEKGIVEYAEAARIVKAKFPQTRFILLGGLDSNPNGVRRAGVEQWVAEGILEWPGHVDVRPWLKQASVYVLPSYYREGIPRSIQEALASGRPVITTTAPGCRETVVEGGNGLLVPVRDVDALVGAMLTFVQRPELVQSMGRASRMLAEEKFDVREINRTMISSMGL
ncbi:MAG TPA: glycosyltransferase family 4 protein [Pseudorhizobium sp.]|nr:glycosyltransferase family 4 protein [Pseudorhizobium sp.]